MSVTFSRLAALDALPVCSGNQMRSSSRKSTLAGILVLVWLMVITGYYFVYHKPFSPAVGVRLGQAAFELAISFGTISIAGGVGKLVVGIFAAAADPGDTTSAARPGNFRTAAGSGPGIHPLGLMAAEAVLGLGLLSLVVLILGAVLPVSRLSGWVLFIALGLVFRRQILSWWRGWRGLPHLIRGSGRIGQLGLLGVALILGLSLLVVVAPPVKFDSLVYHLALPAGYVQAGRIVFTPGNIFWGMPQTVEMLSTWGITLAGVNLPAAISWWFGVLGLAGLAGLTAAWIGLRFAWVGPVSLMSGYSLAVMLSWGYVDWAAFAFGWAFLFWIIDWRFRGHPSSILLAGTMAGMALGTKYTAGLILLAGCGVILWDRRRSLQETARALVWFGIPALIVTAPWWVKNLLASGSPFYPLLFPAGPMDPVRLAFYQEHQAWGTWLDAVFLPLRATILGLEGNPGFGSSSGPFLLGLGGIAWLGLKERPPGEQTAIRTAGIVAILGLLGWAIAGRISGLLITTRLYLSLFPAFGFLAASGFRALAGLRLANASLARVIGVFILFIFGLNIFQVGESVHRSGAVRYMLGEIQADQYLTDNLGWYTLAMDAAQGLPPPARVLMLWEARGYYCQPVCEPDEVLDRWVHLARTRSSPAAILQSWQEAGFTHLLFYRAGADFIRADDPRYRPEEWAALESLLASLPPPVDFGGTYELYTLQP